MDEILATFRPDLFAGKRVLVSGGASCIGLALAKGFARLGAEVTAEAALALRSVTWRSSAPLSVATERDAILALDAFTSTFAPRP
jgi:hypothetical protein